MRTRRFTKNHWGKKRISNDGVAIVEFAFVAMVFFVLFFAILDFSRLMLMYHHVGNAAREGSRWAMVHGSTSLEPATSEAVEDYVKSISPLDSTNISAIATWPNGNAPKNRVNVRVEYPFKFTLPIFFGSGFTLVSTSQMVISY